jgi:hypothetical protein
MATIFFENGDSIDIPDSYQPKIEDSTVWIVEADGSMTQLNLAKYGKIMPETTAPVSGTGGIATTPPESKRLLKRRVRPTVADDGAWWHNLNPLPWVNRNLDHTLPRFGSPTAGQMSIIPPDPSSDNELEQWSRLTGDNREEQLNQINKLRMMQTPPEGWEGLGKLGLLGGAAKLSEFADNQISARNAHKDLLQRGNKARQDLQRIASKGGWPSATTSATLRDPNLLKQVAQTLPDSTNPQGTGTPWSNFSAAEIDKARESINAVEGSLRAEYNPGRIVENSPARKAMRLARKPAEWAKRIGPKLPKSSPWAWPAEMIGEGLYAQNISNYAPLMQANLAYQSAQGRGEFPMRAFSHDDKLREQEIDASRKNVIDLEKNTGAGWQNLFEGKPWHPNSKYAGGSIFDNYLYKPAGEFIANTAGRLVPHGALVGLPEGGWFPTAFSSWGDQSEGSLRAGLKELSSPTTASTPPPQGATPEQVARREQIHRELQDIQDPPGLELNRNGDRLMPDGSIYHPGPAEMQKYNALIDELSKIPSSGVPNRVE